MTCLVAAHQPNYLPWLGYFDKMMRADVFVVLDGVQFPKTGGTWTNRTAVLLNGQATWLTVPIVRKYTGFRTILEMRIDESRSWRAKHSKSLQSSYGRAPAFEEVWSILSPLMQDPTSNLAEYNLSLIRAVAANLGISMSKIVKGSEIRAQGSATEMLISTVREVGGDAYLSGGGASGYQKDAKFDESGVALREQAFVEPVRDQHGSEHFVAGLSVIDSLMNLGFDGTRDLLTG